MKIVLSDILKGKKRIALSGHVRPDGDCVGSSMGLYLYLTEQFPEIEVDLYLEKIPASFHNLAYRGNQTYTFRRDGI
mgnify:CR=1 FL=1